MADPIHLGRIRKVSTASDGHYIEVKEAVLLDFYTDDVRLCDDFVLVPGLGEEVIIGAATLQKWKIKLDFEHEQVIVDPRIGRLQLI